jgi:hypothetical protein
MPNTARTLHELARATASSSKHPRLRTQAACVRTLSHELSRYDLDDPCYGSLRAQLQDEVSQLSDLIEEAAVPPPPFFEKRLR